MKVYNPFKREEYTNKVSKFWLERLYESIDISEREYEIYVDDKNNLSEIAYVIKDKELGDSLFDIIQELKSYGKIDLKYSEFRIRKTVIDPKEKTLLAFYVEVFLKDPDYHLNTIEALIDVVTFASKLSEYNFGFISTSDGKFLNRNLYQVFCSLEKVYDMSKDEIDKRNIPFLLDFIHQNISKSAYRDVFSKSCIEYEMSNISYSLEMFRMFYDYNIGRDIDILTVLEAENNKEKNFRCDKYGRNCDRKICTNFDLCLIDYDAYILPSTDILENESDFIKNEESSNYTIYNPRRTIGGYKIFKNPIESDFYGVKQLYFVNEVKKYLKYEITGIVYDLDGNFLGYKFGKCKSINFDTKNTILSYNFSSPYEIINVLWKLKKLLFDINKNSDDNNCFDYDFDIEKDIVLEKSNSEFILHFVSDEKILGILNNDEGNLKDILSELALKMYHNYIKERYQNLDKKSFYNNPCIKFLPPKFAKSLFKYINNELVDLISAYYSFFVDFCKNYSGNSDNFYYSKFMYNPGEVDYILEYEIFEKLGCVYMRDVNVTLADGRIAYFFNRAKTDSSSVLDKIDKNMLRIKQVFGDYDNVHLTGISNVIYSKKIGSNGMYNMIGYVSDKNEGIPLSKVDFSKFTNKDYIKLAIKVFMYFDKVYIDMDQVRIDNDFNIYINVVDGKIDLYKVGKENFAIQFLKKLESDCIFIKGMDIETAKEIGFDSLYKLEKLYDSMTSYCDIHNAYYPSDEALCPICDKTLFSVEKYHGDYGKVLFEDEYAKHYYLYDKDLNLKVYKENTVDLNEVEKSIDMMINPICHENSDYYGQELFLPYKKAIVLSNKKFVGYVYRYVDFEKCKDFEKHFTNKKKLKSLIILLDQVKAIFNRGLDFLYNPYDSLLISLDYKGKIQIVNIDLLKVGDIKLHQKNEKMLIKYITNSISNEDAMEEIYANSIDSLQDKLEDLVDNMTKICKVHGIFYHKKYMLCPKCVPNFTPELIRNNSIYCNIKDFTKKENFVGEGGESTVYDYGHGTCAKIFRIDEEDVTIEQKVGILIKIFERKNALIELNKKYKNIEYIPPQKIIIDNDTNSIVGYTLKKVEGGYPISSLKNKDIIEGLHFIKKDIFEILIALGDAILNLHENVNMFIGDLNGENILFDANKKIYLIDFDGMGIDDISPRCFTDGYIDPISEKNETVSKKDDWYSFAIHCFYYLTYVHPFNGIYIDKTSNKKLDEVEKMEKRISLLGDHNIEIPEVAEDWGWMSNDMLNVFLQIFEKESRENITPYLKEYYNDHFSQKFSVKKTFSRELTSSKTKKVTREISLFGDRCKKIINSFSYISLDTNDNEVLTIVTGNGEIKVLCDNLDNILDIKLSGNEKFILVIYKNAVKCINIITNETVYENKLYQKTTAIVNDNTFYYSNFEDGENIIVKLRIKDGYYYPHRSLIKFHVEDVTKSFIVNNNEKFIVVKSKNNTGIIYCNDIEYKKLPDTDNVEYKVLYDIIRNEWLVINSDGFYIVIRSDGTNISKLDNKITGCNINKAEFRNGNIYIPKDGAFYYINTKNSQSKEISCYAVTKNSNIIVNKQSFVFFDDKKAYEYAKN